MKTTCACVASAALALGAWSGVSHAGVVYSNGECLLAGGLNAGPMAIADDFVLSASAQVNAMQVDLGFSTGASVSSISFSVYRDNGGTPGSLMHSGMATVFRTFSIAAPDGVTYATVEFDLPTEYEFAAGVRYWLAMRHEPAGNARFLSYSTQDLGLDPVQREVGTTNWHDAPGTSDIAFRLLSNVPAPAAASVLMLLGMTQALRRRRS